MSQPELEFRPATVDDVSALVEVSTPLYEEFDAEHLLWAVSAHPDIHMYFALRQQEPVGSLMITPQDTITHAILHRGYQFVTPKSPHTTAWIDGLLVKPSERGRGLATKMIAWGIETAGRQGYRAVEMRTAHPVPDYVINQIGMSACGEIPLPDGSTGYKYAKNLSEQLLPSVQETKVKEGV